MATKKKATTKGVTTGSMRNLKLPNDITEIKRPLKLSLSPTPILCNSFLTPPLLNSSRLPITVPIMLEKSLEDIISEFYEKF